MTDNVFLSIALENFEEKKKEGIKNSEINSDEESMSWENLIFDNDENSEFRDGKLCISGDLLGINSNKFGFLSLNVNLDLDIVIEIIDFYMKKLGKLKTVLEATK